MDTIFKYKNYEFADNDLIKTIHSKKFNLFFNKESGYLERWGKTKRSEDDPLYCELGPLVVDIELVKDIPDDLYEKYKNETLLENKQCKGKCPMCFKSNGVTKYTHVMTFLKYKELLMKLLNTHVRIDNKLVYFLDKINYKGQIINAIDYPDLNIDTDICNCAPVNQLALVITNLDANPELLRICEFSKQMGVIPNVTCHGRDNVSDEFLQRLCSLCGNVAVSRYDKELSYDFIQRLHYCGARQTDMDMVVAEETFDNVMQALKDTVNDGRLKYLNAVTLLLLKQHGRGTNYHILTEEHFNELFDYVFANQIRFSVDPCSFWRLREYIRKFRSFEFNNYHEIYEFCDSNRVTCYVNSLGEYYPCSFIEGESIWPEPPNLFKIHNFIDEVWNSEKSNLYNTMLASNEFKCLCFKI